MTEVAVENPSKKKFNLKIDASELEQIEEQNEPLTGMASEHPTGTFNFKMTPEKNQISDVVSSHSHASHASSVKQEALHDRIEQIKRELMGIQNTDPADDFVSPAKNQDLM